MGVFYAHLAQKESKAEALRNAALSILHTGLPPYYWAGFQIVGDPDGTLATANRGNTK
jgi:CHAT domain-containing protein